MRIDDPWYDVPLPGRDDPAAASAPAETPARQGSSPSVPRQDAHAAVYLAVHRSAAFQQVRGHYRRFVVPASLAFLAWYLAYVVAAIAAPGFMARPISGVFNVAMAAGLAQFATTFGLTWAYTRHARLHRDRAALELRWETQNMTRAPGQAPTGRRHAR